MGLVPCVLLLFFWGGGMMMNDVTRLVPFLRRLVQNTPGVGFNNGGPEIFEAMVGIGQYGNFDIIHFESFLTSSACQPALVQRWSSADYYTASCLAFLMVCPIRVSFDLGLI